LPIAMLEPYGIHLSGKDRPMTTFTTGC
jgi:hypothetical protein